MVARMKGGKKSRVKPREKGNNGVMEAPGKLRGVGKKAKNKESKIWQQNRKNRGKKRPS